MKRPCTNEAVLCDISQVMESVAEGLGYRAWSIIDARGGTIQLNIEYPSLIDPWRQKEIAPWRETDARSSNGKTPDSTSGDASSILCTGCQP